MLNPDALTEPRDAVDPFPSSFKYRRLTAFVLSPKRQPMVGSGLVGGRLSRTWIFNLLLPEQVLTRTDNETVHRPGAPA
jgi:hypothetical protein